MEASYDLNQEMRTWVSPSLIEANYILSLSRMDLQAVIAAEMDANPALEMDDRPACPLCGNVLDGTFCPTCLVSQRTEPVTESYEDFPETMVNALNGREDSDEFDPMSLIAHEENIRAVILTDARTQLDPRDYPIAEYLVDGLDERGFLTTDLDDLAALINRSREDIDDILAVIQELAPAGVGARDLQECLLLQLSYLARNGHDVPEPVLAVVSNFLPEFGAHKYGQISKELGLSPDEIDDVREFIRVQLSPFPLQSQAARSWRTPTRAAYVAPDVIIVIKDEELTVEVVDTKQFYLRISPIYSQLAGDLGRRRTAAEPPAASNGTGPAVNGTIPLAVTSTEDRGHVRQYSSRAKLFISNIQQRRETLLKISRCICTMQESFLRGGVRELRPLTRAIVAQHVGVHESTVSRATANKYVMLPTRKVIPFSDFFTPSLSIKDVIKELIEREAKKGGPLTDRRIGELLHNHGIRIARRTVAKYRAELGILPSTMR
ncbi:MAG: RNA polymerase factor sigma-54 [Chloroflexia bacterium]|nr:RNA polymerase factor sigma-54 [Chloroflexia bacterium]